MYIFAALANVAGSFVVCTLAVEIQTGVKAAPFKNNVKRTNCSMGMAFIIATLLYLLVAITGMWLCYKGVRALCWDKNR